MTSGGEGYTNLGFARVDTAREERQGVAECVYAPGKETDQIIAIVAELLRQSRGPVLVTRIPTPDADTVARALPGATHDPEARLLRWRDASPRSFRLAVVSAGTADTRVAAEAAGVARAVGLTVATFHDVGVAGIHRTLDCAAEIATYDAVVVVAGMEGGLASVIAGLVAVPVIAVPVSSGYGAALEGVTALLAMMSTCAAGLTVVNIDSGFGAAMAAHRLATTVESSTARHGSGEARR
ncbi:nickel pincer cofactor biosynthesis protein LarB [Spiractinospora alimapuensis]|uniref:nickel pincer cofactor biosynthesis protein LarB n=1 Tax=Spiractinospora alimapuensis TaxID=2820884 RepID=UPI001F1F0EF9|nr:nickel pincer cofactor biosynthesis protein LarB [Spiractinospora alimapuensis]QVQ52644.1 nickel pincer cofactor biosynthesis protein LarB [Spiractinospora alimapuensis]